MQPSFKDQLDVAHTLLTIIAIVVGGGWGISEYVEKKHQDRIGKSFEIVSKFRSSEDVRHYDDFANSESIGAVLSNAGLSVAEKSDQIKKLHTPEVQAYLARVIGLYEDASVCVRVSHCDKDVIAEFMAPEANSVNVISNGVITSLRARYKDPHYAEELEQIRNWYCELPTSVKANLKTVSWCQ